MLSVVDTPLPMTNGGVGFSSGHLLLSNAYDDAASVTGASYAEEETEGLPIQFIATRRELTEFRNTDEQTLVTQLVNVVTHFLWRSLLV